MICPECAEEIPGTPGRCPYCAAEIGCTVVIKDPGPNRSGPLLRIVREATGLSLQESDDFLNSCPRPLKSGLTKRDAEGLVWLLSAAGASAEVREPPRPKRAVLSGSCSVVLSRVGPNPMDVINMIKAVREIAGLGLREAKALVLSAPAVVRSGLPFADAESIAQRLEAAGASVEITGEGPTSSPSG